MLLSTLGAVRSRMKSKSSTKNNLRGSGVTIALRPDITTITRLWPNKAFKIKAPRICVEARSRSIEKTTARTGEEDTATDCGRVGGQRPGSTALLASLDCHRRSGRSYDLSFSHGRIGCRSGADLLGWRCCAAHGSSDLIWCRLPGAAVILFFAPLA